MEIPPECPADECFVTGYPIGSRNLKCMPSLVHLGLLPENPIVPSSWTSGNRATISRVSRESVDTITFHSIFALGDHYSPLSDFSEHAACN